MKKNLLIICLILICGTQIFAQKKWYVSFNGGYALKMSPQNLYNEELEINFLNYTRQPESDGGSYRTYEQITTSLGKGTNFNLSAGYMFNENFGIDMGFSYMFGGKTNSKYEYYGKYIVDYDFYNNPIYSNYSEISDNSISSNMFRINPSLFFTFGTKTITPYAKFGLILGMGSITYELTNIDEDEYYNLNEQYFVKLKMNGGIALGCNASLGLSYNIGETITLFSELNLISMSYAPTKGKIVEYTENGRNELHDLTTSEKEFLFVGEYSYSTSDNVSDYEPTKMLNYRYPFSNMGFNLGVRINF